jgi:hypothetical protein
MPPRHAALGARLMRPRRAAWPAAAPAGSARSTIGAVAHRGDDPPHDGGIAADSVRRGVIIWRPASRSRFGGLAFDDLDDVEGSHVRHDPPSPGPLRAVNRCHRLGTRARTLRAPGPATGDGTGRTFPLLVQSRRCGSRYQIGRGREHPSFRVKNSARISCSRSISRWWSATRTRQGGGSRCQCRSRRTSPAGASGQDGGDAGHLTRLPGCGRPLVVRWDIIWRARLCLV